MNKVNDAIVEHNNTYQVWLPRVWFQWVGYKAKVIKNKKIKTSGMSVLITVRKFTVLSNYDLETELDDTEPF
jgi:hypothetical protein